MDQGDSRALKRFVLGTTRAAQRFVIEAQADLLQEPREAASGVSPSFADHPPGWSLYPLYWPRGCLPPSRQARRQAEQMLRQSYPRDPAGRALRALHRSKSEHDCHFVELLWEDRPKLVAAVALYSRLTDFDFHPDVYRERIEKPAFEAATKSVPLTEDWVGMVQRYSKRRAQRERLEQYRKQLNALGWGGWNVPEGEVEPRAPKGGGEPMPCWMLPCDPLKLDGEPGDFGGWWSVSPPGDPERRKGRFLYAHTVEAILDALDIGANHQEDREKVGRHVPAVFGEQRRDPSPDGLLKQTMGNILTRHN